MALEEEGVEEVVEAEEEIGVASRCSNTGITRKQVHAGCSHQYIWGRWALEEQKQQLQQPEVAER